MAKTKTPKFFKAGFVRDDLTGLPGWSILTSTTKTPKVLQHVKLQLDFTRPYVYSLLGEGKYTTTWTLCGGQITKVLDRHHVKAVFRSNCDNAPPVVGRYVWEAVLTRNDWELTTGEIVTRWDVESLRSVGPQFDYEKALSRRTAR